MVVRPSEAIITQKTENGKNWSKSVKMLIQGPGAHRRPNFFAFLTTESNSPHQNTSYMYNVLHSDNPVTLLKVVNEYTHVFC